MRAPIRLLTMLLLPTATLAQTPTPDPVRIEFVIFDQTEIIGGRARALLARMEGRQRPEFVPLVSLKRNFLGKLKGTARDATLR